MKHIRNTRLKFGSIRSATLGKKVFAEEKTAEFITAIEEFSLASVNPRF